MGSDVMLIVYWWSILLLFGVTAFAASRLLFRGWWDSGYGLSKGVGLAIVTYFVWIAGRLRVAPFVQMTIVFSLALLFVIGAGGTILWNRVNRNTSKKQDKNTFLNNKRIIFTVVGYEAVFLALLWFWAWVKAHEPSIRSLEKFMDFGFTQSILNSAYFPAPDIWYAGEPINYYTFGHTAMAVLTKFSGLDLAYTYNLMLSTLFALTATMSFSVGTQICRDFIKSRMHRDGSIRRSSLWAGVGGVLSGFFITMGGNLQTIYVLTSGYNGEDAPPPFWNILLPFDQWAGALDGMSYWYANATRFIPFTIHEFPSYSFVVSDIHGHVLSIPFVLVTVAILYDMFVKNRDRTGRSRWVMYVVIGLMVSILFMTNALDGLIYMGLFTFLALLASLQKKHAGPHALGQSSLTIVFVAITAAVFTFPFFTYFRSFVSGIGVNCPPSFLAGLSIGPFIIEGVEKCQHSPLWQLMILWGFFVYAGVWLAVSVLRVKRHRLAFVGTSVDWFMLSLFVFSMALLAFPEFLYFRDIYPAHFRSNTMFKLGYQAFIMCGFLVGFVIVRMALVRKRVLVKAVYFIFLAPMVFFVSLFPIYATQTYFGRLETYRGIYGLSWLSQEFPTDMAAIRWLKEEEQTLYRDVTDTPVIVEAEGESYTDAARVSAFTGIPAVVGWPVHEWLWRGSYDVVSPRIEDVKTIYTSGDIERINQILRTYSVDYVIVGTQERIRYPDVNEIPFTILGEAVFRSGETVIYKITE